MSYYLIEDSKNGAVIQEFPFYEDAEMFMNSSIEFLNENGWRCYDLKTSKKLYKGLNWLKYSIIKKRDWSN